MLQQIAVFLENKKGRLAMCTRILGDNDIDLIALSIADTTDFGIMRCIVDQPEKALEVLTKGGFTASSMDVLAVEVPDTPGGLAGVLELVDAADINVEYLYSFVRTPRENALITFRVDDPERCQKLFMENGITVLSDEAVYGSTAAKKR
ncbi:amino acid-binding protein [Eubacteriales bacterium OttesenSCG-928-M02]|nr:amino acid-binding protein [Eubacteriales bacterium OttesenSCG-928-M02]